MDDNVVDEIDKNVIDNAIKRTINKIREKENIKEDLFYLDSIYDYIVSEFPERISEFDYLKRALSKFKLYVFHLRGIRKQISNKKKYENVRLEKEHEYKTIWINKGLLYRLFNFLKNPSNIDFLSISESDLNDKIDKLKK